MVQDTRRVQTAVLGNPDSDHPLSLPTDRNEAEWYLSRYKGQKFYCGVLIGGCGWRLMDKLYGDRVCHFAHFPDNKGMAPECERRYHGPDSADHLFIHRGLTSGMRVRPRFEGRMEDGRCTDLLVRHSQTRSAIKVQFVNLSSDEWEQQDEELRAQFGRVDWLLGSEATGTARYLVNRDGYALRVRCEPDKSGARVVKVGTETSDGDLEWSNLDDCEITVKGVVTPLLRESPPRLHHPTAGRSSETSGFPLLVKDIVVIPKETFTRPISGLGFPPDSHVAAIDAVIIGGGEPIRARIVVPDRLDLAVGKPYSLVEPASVDAGIREGQPSPAWTIFSAGMLQKNPVGSASPPQVNVTKSESSESIPSAPTKSAPIQRSSKKVGGSREADVMVRHKLTALIGDLRKARRLGDHSSVMTLLGANQELLSEVTRRGFQRERSVLTEIERWVTAKTRADEKIERDVRRKCERLSKQVEQAKADMNLAEAQRAIESYRKNLVQVSVRNPRFQEQAQFLRANEKWLKQARDAQARAIRLADETRKANSHRQQSRLEDRIGKHSDPLTPRVFAKLMIATLQRVARDQSTIAFHELMKCAEGNCPPWLVRMWTRALVCMDEPAGGTKPLLSALVTSADQKVVPEFRTILEELGFDVPRTDRGLELVWKREVERVHAYYAQPPRPMPERLVPRKEPEAGAGL
jgi:hypothetical protein